VKLDGSEMHMQYEKAKVSAIWAISVEHEFRISVQINIADRLRNFKLLVIKKLVYSLPFKLKINCIGRKVKGLRIEEGLNLAVSGYCWCHWKVKVFIGRL